MHCHLKPAQIFSRLNDSFAHALNESQELDVVPVSNDLVAILLSSTHFV